MHTKSRELLLQVLRDRNIRVGQVVDARTSSDVCGPRNSRTIETRKIFLQQHLPAARSDVIEDYFKRNARRIPIETVYGRIDYIDLRSEAELDQIFSDTMKGWRTFREKFPHSQGILQISCAGFSLDGTQGMICIGQQEDWEAGDGVLYLYANKASGWRKQGEFMAWIS